MQKIGGADRIETESIATTTGRLKDKGGGSQGKHSFSLNIKA